MTDKSASTDYPKVQIDLVGKGLQNVCPFKAEVGQQDPNNPHFHEKLTKPKKIYDSIIDAMGNTPMIRMDRIAEKEGI